MKIHLKREWQLAEGNGQVCTTVGGRQEVTQHHRPPIPRKIAWKLAAAARTTTPHFSIWKQPTEFELTKRNAHATTLQRTSEIQVQTHNAAPGEILHNQRKPNSEIMRG
jgi:hypothetical protein